MKAQHNTTQHNTTPKQGLTGHEKKGRTARAATAAVLTASIALGATGCSEPGEPRPAVTTSVEVAAPQAAKAVKSVEKLTPEEQIANYVASPERNERIAAFVQSAGERVVANGPSQIGYFDFYNPQNDKWKDGNNKGWGRYQHNPQYGGSASQVIVTAYQDGNGKIDPSQGIKSLHIDMFSEGQPYSVSFTAPEERQLVSDSPSTHRTGWEVSIVNTNELGKSEDPNTTWETVSGSSWQMDSESVQSIADAQRIEANAMALTDQYLAQLGL